MRKEGGFGHGNSCCSRVTTLSATSFLLCVQLLSICRTAPAPVSDILRASGLTQPVPGASRPSLALTLPARHSLEANINVMRLSLRGGGIRDKPAFNFSLIRPDPFSQREMPRNAETEDVHLPDTPFNVKIRTQFTRVLQRAKLAGTEEEEELEFPARVLPSSEYIKFKRPGIANKRMWAACELGDDEELELVVLHLQTDVNFKDENNHNLTALFRAAMNGHVSTVKLLGSLGADPNAKDIFGSTAMHFAADRGWPKVVEALAELGCDPCAENELGRTALDWAHDCVRDYNTSRTAEEDHLWHPYRNFEKHGLYSERVGSHIETLHVLRRVMRLPPLDKIHLTGALQVRLEYKKSYEEKVARRKKKPRTVFDMPVIMPDGKAFHEALILNACPRSPQSRWYQPHPDRQVVYNDDFRNDTFALGEGLLVENPDKEPPRSNRPWRSTPLQKTPPRTVRQNAESAGAKSSTTPAPWEKSAGWGQRRKGYAFSVPSHKETEMQLQNPEGFSGNGYNPFSGMPPPPPPPPPPAPPPMTS